MNVNINLNSLNSIKDNGRVLIDNEGSFSKASFFTKRSTIDTNKEKIVSALKEHVQSNPRYFGIQEHIKGLIDGLMTSKSSAKGITAGQIKDIISYADSLSTPKERTKTLMSAAASCAREMHASKNSATENRRFGYPESFANTSEKIKNSYSSGMHKHISNLINTSHNTSKGVTKSQIQAFDASASQILNLCKTLNLDDKTTEKILKNTIENGYDPDLAALVCEYINQICSNQILSDRDKNLLLDIALTENGPIAHDKFNKAMTAKENNAICSSFIAADNFNSKIESEIKALGFDENSNIKDTVIKALHNSVSKFSLEGKKLDTGILESIASDIMKCYQFAAIEADNLYGDNKVMLKTALENVASLSEPPKEGYVKVMSDAASNISNTIKDSLKTVDNVAFFDLKLNAVSQALIAHTSAIDSSFLPETDSFKTQLCAFMLGQNLAAMPEEQRSKLFESLTSPNMQALAKLYQDDSANATSAFNSIVMTLLKDQLAFIDGKEIPQTEPSSDPLPLSVQNRINKDTFFSGGASSLIDSIPKEFLGNYDINYDNMSKTMFHTNMLSEVKHLIKQDTLSAFQADIARQTNITLPNGVKLAKGFENARSQIYDYLMEKEGIRVENSSANPPQSIVNKAMILMSCLQQESEKLAVHGPTFILSNSRLPIFLTASDGNPDKEYKEFNVREDGDGGFFIDYQLKKGLQVITVETLQQPIMCPPGSTESYDMTIHINGDDLNRVSQLDFNKLADYDAPDLFASDYLKEWRTNIDLNEFNMPNTEIVSGFNYHIPIR